MKQFKLFNIIFGWAAFAVAAFTYLSTIESTASFWDCGEFISTAYKLDVGHPPGAPFFMLTGRFFSLFASDPTHVAQMINAMSALCSAFTILFLFWTITHLTAKVVIKNKETDYTLGNNIAIIGAGLVGALTYTFSDTFWFSAVEGEVYAYSSLFTAAVFWLILKWESVADNKGSDRWLILIAYLMGLSIGVHLLNLLTIPAIVLVYYFKRYNPSVKGALLAMCASAVILLFVLYGLVPGFVEVASWFELLFVNSFGMPFNSGLMVYIVLSIGALAWALYETYVQKSYTRAVISFIVALSLIGVPFLRGSVVIGLIVIAAVAGFFYYKRKTLSLRWLNTIVAMAAVMLIGYSSYSVIYIRSMANPAMDQNSPDNVFALKGFLNREQYGDRPLFYGPVYNAPVKWEQVGNSNKLAPMETKGEPIYAPKPKESPNEKDEYSIIRYKSDYVREDGFNMLFPRMYSQNGQHIEAYKVWGDIKGKRVTYNYAGQQRTDVIPTFGENLRFFFDYQVNFMYWRYFMWNFSGRQNDIQGQGEVSHGNWITGIKVIDKMLVGDSDLYPSELTNNKGNNKYYMLPLILGLIGIFFQLGKGSKGTQSFWVTLLLFFLTGLAIVLYLNQTPYQVRERDYAYAGSFYAFSIWIGVGVMGLVELFKKAKLPTQVAAPLATIICMGVPVLMGAQNWDDHDRSNRYVARDFGGNYLASCEPNAIIFTYGDNDTFPLWYNQEVEGYRSDVRVCNLSYLQTDWYIDQMRRGYYESAPLPISWQPKDYISGKNEFVRAEDMVKQALDVTTALDFIRSNDASTKSSDGESFIPTKQLFIPVDVSEVIANGALPESRKDEIVPQINFTFDRAILKSELIILDMINQNKWKRPIYFATTIGDGNNMNLRKNGHLVLTGMAYKLLPINTTGKLTQIDIDTTYNNLMNKFRYGNVKDPKVYVDETARRMASSHRVIFSQLVDLLIAANDTARAKKVLDYCLQELPSEQIGYDNLAYFLSSAYYKIGETQKANELMEKFLQKNNEYLAWGLSLNRNQRNSIMSELNSNMTLFTEVMRNFEVYKQTALLDKYMPAYQEYYKRFQ